MLALRRDAAALGVYLYRVDAEELLAALLDLNDARAHNLRFGDGLLLLLHERQAAEWAVSNLAALDYRHLRPFLARRVLKQHDARVHGKRTQLFGVHFGFFPKIHARRVRAIDAARDGRGLALRDLLLDLIQRGFAHGAGRAQHAARHDLRPAQRIVNGMHETDLILPARRLGYGAFAGR